MNLSQLQRERNEWVARNFPNTGQPEESILGVIEEIGELAHADLKQRQGIRGTAEEHEAAGKDAVGDTVVYLAGYFTFHKLTMPDDREAVVREAGLLRSEQRSPEASIFRLSRCAGMLGFVQGAAGPTALGWAIIYHLMEYCALRGWDFDECVETTWNRVKKRDWVADPQAGGERPPTDREVIDSFRAQHGGSVKDVRRHLFGDQ